MDMTRPPAIAEVAQWKGKSAATEKKADSGPEPRPSRRRRSRGRRGAGRSGRSSESGSNSSGSNSSGSKPRRSRNRSRHGGNGEGRRDRDSIDARTPKDGDEKKDSSQRHPEDVEDTFDW